MSICSTNATFAKLFGLKYSRLFGMASEDFLPLLSRSRFKMRRALITRLSLLAFLSTWPVNLPWERCATEPICRVIAH